MACSVWGGSCSLCPWCEEGCPHSHNQDNDKRYKVYATNREKNSLTLLVSLNTKGEVVEFVKKLINRKWGKNYRVAKRIDKRVVKKDMYKVKREYLPYVELVIADEKLSWHNVIDLLINTEDKTISYYDIWATEFYPYVDEGQDVAVKIIKPWDEELNFIDMRELPWYPYKKADG